MEYRQLGSTGITVSRLCFGGLAIGPLQAGMSVRDGADVIAGALALGVNFIDTAEIYGTYPHIREAVKKSGIRPVIATKSYAYSVENAKKSVEKARREMDADVLDIFLMHEQESRKTLAGHRAALDHYLDMKVKGVIRAVGVSTHRIEVVEACAEMPEIDVIHPIVNRTGVGIGDGSIEDMLGAVRRAAECGKGIYGMKPLGGGNLLGTWKESLAFVLSIDCLHSIALGMKSMTEVEADIAFFDTSKVPQEMDEALNRVPRKLHIEYWCEGCGACLKRCGQGALRLANGKAAVDMEKCILCGYCGSACGQFAIKIC